MIESPTATTTGPLPATSTPDSWNQWPAVRAPGKSAALVWSPGAMKLVARAASWLVSTVGGAGKWRLTATSAAGVIASATGSDSNSSPAGMLAERLPPNVTTWSLAVTIAALPGLVASATCTASMVSGVVPKRLDRRRRSAGPPRDR